MDAATVVGKHAGVVRCLAVVPGSGLLASGGDDKLVQLWDAREHGLRAAATVDVAAGVLRLAIDPTRGSWLLTVDERGGLRVYDTRTLTLLRELEIGRGDAARCIDVGSSAVGWACAMKANGSLGVWDATRDWARQTCNGGNALVAQTRVRPGGLAVVRLHG